MTPDDEKLERLFYVAAVYVSLIIIKTIFEAVGVSEHLKAQLEPTLLVCSVSLSPSMATAFVHISEVRCSDGCCDMAGE